ncbi:MAG TPA: hypothetical protein VNP72_07335 [Longimicrobium sp.]|nr:hypothetical protein [Longimicrobium sp.]
MELWFIVWILFIVFFPAMLRRLKQQQGTKALMEDLDRSPRGHTYHEHRRSDMPALHQGRMSAAVFHAEADAFDVFRDEIATDSELSLETDMQVVSADDTATGEIALAVAPRPLPAAVASLEQEVDWEVEHERFHKRYVDARAAATPVIHTLLGDLRDDPQALRRAILLAEVLGPPVGDR